MSKVDLDPTVWPTPGGPRSRRLRTAAARLRPRRHASPRLDPLGAPARTHLRDPTAHLPTPPEPDTPADQGAL